MSNKGAKFYGYIVLLVAVITFLISINKFIGSFFDLSDPLHANHYRFMGKSLASFETYKMDILNSPRTNVENLRLPRINIPNGKAVYIPDDETLKGMYKATKEDRILTVTLSAYRNMTVNGILVVLSIGLFIFHWFWLRKI